MEPGSPGAGVGYGLGPASLPGLGAQHDWGALSVSLWGLDAGTSVFFG